MCIGGTGRVIRLLVKVCTQTFMKEDTIHFVNYVKGQGWISDTIRATIMIKQNSNEVNRKYVELERIHDTRVFPSFSRFRLLAPSCNDIQFRSSEGKRTHAYTPVGYQIMMRFFLNIK